MVSPLQKLLIITIITHSHLTTTRHANTYHIS